MCGAAPMSLIIKYYHARYNSFFPVRGSFLSAQSSVLFNELGDGSLNLCILQVDKYFSDLGKDRGEWGPMIHGVQ